MAVCDARLARSAMRHAVERAGVERQRVGLKGVPIVRVLSASVRAGTQAEPRTIVASPCGTRIRLLSPFSLRFFAEFAGLSAAPGLETCVLFALLERALHALPTIAMTNRRRAL